MQKGDIQKLISDGPSKSNGYLISKAWVSALNEKPESDQLLQLPPINNLPLLELKGKYGGIMKHSNEQQIYSAANTFKDWNFMSLKEGINEKSDFEVISYSTWSKLIDKFGGGPTIIIYVTEHGHLDLSPITLSLILKTDNEKIVGISFSQKVKLKTILRTICPYYDLAYNKAILCKVNVSHADIMSRYNSPMELPGSIGSQKFHYHEKELDKHKTGEELGLMEHDTLSLNENTFLKEITQDIDIENPMVMATPSGMNKRGPLYTVPPLHLEHMNNSPNNGWWDDSDMAQAINNSLQPNGDLMEGDGYQADAPMTERTASTDNSFNQTAGETTCHIHGRNAELINPGELQEMIERSKEAMRRERLEFGIRPLSFVLHSIHKLQEGFKDRQVNFQKGRAKALAQNEEEEKESMTN